MTPCFFLSISLFIIIIIIILFGRKHMISKYRVFIYLLFIYNDLMNKEQLFDIKSVGV